MIDGSPLSAVPASALVQGRLESGYDYVGYLVSDNQRVCAATLLSKDTIITAAHCLSESAGDNFKFGLGTFDPESTNLANVILIRYADGFNPLTNSGADLAVARIDKKYETRELPELAEATTTCTASIVAYGSGVQDGLATVDQFRKKSGEGCISNPTSSFLISFNREVGMCYGDSGGPIFAGPGSNQLIGILTGGLVNNNLSSLQCDSGNVGVALSVMRYASLINDFSDNAAGNYRQLAGSNSLEFEQDFSAKVAAESPINMNKDKTDNPGVEIDMLSIIIYLLTFSITLLSVYFLTKPLRI